VPEEDKSHPPRAAPGSRHLPWDEFSIPTTMGCPPGAGGWDGELVCAKAVGGDSRHGGITNATAKSRNVRRNCTVGKPRSVSRNAVPAWKGATNMPRRNGSDAKGRRRGPTCPKVPKWPTRDPQAGAPGAPPPTQNPRVVTQQKGTRKFFAIGPDATIPCENLPVRPPRTAATPAGRL